MCFHWDFLWKILKYTCGGGRREWVIHIWYGNANGGLFIVIWLPTWNYGCQITSKAWLILILLITLLICCVEVWKLEWTEMKWGLFPDFSYLAAGSCWEPELDCSPWRVMVGPLKLDLICLVNDIFFKPCIVYTEIISLSNLKACFWNASLIHKEFIDSKGIGCKWINFVLDVS